jgi:hypothetical protein
LRETRSIHFQVGTFSTIDSSHAGHLRLGIGAAHRVGIDHRTAQMRRRHQRLDGVAAADLERHRRPEAPAHVLLHQGHGAGDGAAVGEPFLADERGTHIGHHGHEVVVGEVLGCHQAHPVALGVQPAHVQEAQIGAAAAARPEDPGTDGERLDVVGGELAHGGQGSMSRKTAATVVMASRVGAPVTARTIRRVGSA